MVKKSDLARLRASLTFGQGSSLPELLTPDEVCAYLGISRRTLWRRDYRYTKENGSNRRRYYADDIRFALALNVKQPSA